MKAHALAVVALLLALAGAVLFASPAAQGATLINAQLTESTGPTPILGGGDYVFVRFGTDAAFGVVYGNASHGNNVYIVAIKARYLGVVQAYDARGDVLASNRPVKIYTLYAVKLDSLVEFKDQNGNGIADYRRGYSQGNFTDYTEVGDGFYKRVSLDTNWTRGAITRTNGTGFRGWSFNLTARNLPYEAVAGYGGSTAGSLPLVRFTFHVNASLEQVDDATVPQWRVTVGTVGNRLAITDAARLDNLTVSGKVAHYDLKWDQEIQGWTYASGNPAANRRILLELGAVVGNLIPASLVEAWLDARAVSRMGEDGTARYDTDAGNGTANGTTGGYTAPLRLKSPYLDFGGNWTRIARFLWVTNATVDGANEPLYGQIMAGFAFVGRGEFGNVFAGFVVLVGLSFKGGDVIEHDPSVTTDVQADLVFGGAQLPGGLSGLLTVLVVVVIIAVGTILVLLLASKRRKGGVPPAVPPT